MDNTDIIKQALEDYDNLVQLVSNYTGTVDELFDKLDGFNREREFFDCNYRSLVATINISDNQLSVSDTIDIWDDVNNTIVEEYASVQELRCRYGN